jgi:hypothetical protein
MNAAEIKLDLFRKIDALKGEKLKEAYDYMFDFFKSHPKKDGKTGLLELSGTMDEKEADEMLNAIEEGCGNIDHNEW